MKPEDHENAGEILNLIEALTTDEGDSVEIAAPSADFGTPDHLIVVRWLDLELDEMEATFTGDSVLECLRKAQKNLAMEEKS